MDKTPQLIEHNDNFLEIKENQIYAARCAGFILRNIGNTTVWIDKTWPLYPGQEYSLQSMHIRTVVSKNYLVQFEVPTQPLPDNQTIDNHVVIAEEYYFGDVIYSNYSPVSKEL
jgi:hypothetical protein